MLVCVSFFLLHTPTMTTRRMLSPKHAHKPECSSCHVNITFPSSIWRYKHRSPLKRWLFFSFSPWVIFSFTLRACQSVKPPPPQHIPTSSLSVVDADMSHLEALPYMCCIDISLLTFPFPRRPDCEAPVTMWKRRLRFLNNSSGLMNAFWRHSCAGVTGSVSSVGGE